MRLSHILLPIFALICFQSATLAADPHVLSLQVAARRGDLETVKKLLAQGVDPAAETSNRSSAVHAAAGGGKVEVLRLLLELGVPPDKPDLQGRRPLYEAATANSVECCQLLLDRGADINAVTVSGATPLYAALVWGGSQSSLFLLQNGAPFDLAGDEAEETPLMTASSRGTPSVVLALLQAGADPHRLDQNGRTALHYAAQAYRLDNLNLLLQHGIDPKIEDQKGINALHLALQTQRWPVTERLLQVTGDYDQALPDVCDWATWEQVEQVLKASQRPNSACLTVASRSGNLEVTRGLLESGSDPNTPDDQGDYPLLVAAQMGWPRVVELLLAHHALPRVKGPSGLDATERMDRQIELLEETREQYSHFRGIPGEARSALAELSRIREHYSYIQSLLCPANLNQFD